MRRAIWMALAFMGTAPLVALAQQQNTGTAPAASPSGAGSIDRGQDTTATQAPGAPGQQSAGTVGTAQGQPATGGAGTQGTTGQGGQQGGTGGTGVGTGAGGTGVGTGGGGTTGPTYRGTTEEIPSASPPLDIGTRVGPEPGEQAGGGGTGTVGTGGGGTGGTGTGTGGTGTGSVGGGGGTGGGASMGGAGGRGTGGAPAAMGSEAMQRELTTLRQRVARLEAQVDALRGTGGAGTGGTGTGGDTGTTDTADIQVQGPVAVATAVFDGRVVDVTPRHIDIVDTSDGAFYRLNLDDQTKAFVGPDLKRIPVEQLSEGTPVRTSFALISGAEHALNIVALPQRQEQQRREQQQRQQEQRQEQMGPGQRMVVPPPQDPLQ